MDRILTRNLNFVDEKGRTRIFNGMNIDDKLLNRETFRYDLDEEFFRQYAEKGFNLIRLAVCWVNIEPEPGKYNESYLQSIDKIFRNAEKYGVYILLDMHQDLFSGYNGVGAGDGAPIWASLTDGYEPKEHKFVWIEGYVYGRWVHSAFDHFWNNDPVLGRGLQDRFADMWQMLAKRYGESPALFGYDIFNEPFPGSDFNKMLPVLIKSALKELAFSRKISRSSILLALMKKDIKGLLDNVPGTIVRDIMENIDKISAEFDAKKYSPFLNRTAKAIREITPKGIFVIEQSFFCNGGVKQSVPPITIDGVREPLQCFGCHGYDMTVDTPLYKYADAERVKEFFREMLHTQMRLNVPTIAAEWGGCSDNKDTSWFGHAFGLLDYFDRNRWSQLYWDYHGDDLSSPLMEMLSRTCPVAVDGTLTGYFTDREKGTFTMKYLSDENSETLVYVHRDADIRCSGNYRTVKKYGNGARIIKIAGIKGENQVIINFRGE